MHTYNIIQHVCSGQGSVCHRTCSNSLLPIQLYNTLQETKPNQTDLVTDPHNTQVRQPTLAITTVSSTLVTVLCNKDHRHDRPCEWFAKYCVVLLQIRVCHEDQPHCPVSHQTFLCTGLYHLLLD